MAVIRITLENTTHDLDLDRCKISEADECERLTGWTWQEWIAAFIEDRAQAVKFAWWIACKRNDAPVEGSFSGLDFDLADFNVDILPAEQPEEATAADVPGPTSPSPDSTENDPVTSSAATDQPSPTFSE